MTHIQLLPVYSQSDAYIFLVKLQIYVGCNLGVPRYS